MSRLSTAIKKLGDGKTPAEAFEAFRKAVSKKAASDVVISATKRRGLSNVLLRGDDFFIEIRHKRNPQLLKVVVNVKNFRADLQDTVGTDDTKVDSTLVEKTIRILRAEYEESLADLD